MMNFHSISLEKLKGWLVQNGEAGFRGAQIFDWIYQKRTSDFEKMTNLNRSLKEKLRQHFIPSSLEFQKAVDSSDGETTKFLWKLSDGKLVESVLIRSHDRRTVCVSSQVGCPARCAFCASGKNGLIRNLSAVEIFEQVYQIDLWLKQFEERVCHVVFMGMGEPFENYDAVVEAIRLLIDETRLNLSQRRLTVSTVGVIEGIRKLSEEGLKVNLVLSLHAPNQQVRKKIIPYARKYPLEDLISAMLFYAEKTGRDITYEYTLLKDINDQIEHATELTTLLKDQQCTVNLIPYNPVLGLHLHRPEKEAIETFYRILTAAGIPTTWRYTKGKDIAAACGQLALQEA